MGEQIAFPRVRAEVAGSRTLQAVPPDDRPVRCVWTRHLRDGRACLLHVPLSAMRVAWQRELELGREEGGFFHFAWHGEVWLGYGLPDGEVRGVYCPAHRAQREERLGYDPELGAPTEPDAGR
ncbi:MAG TPA: hypothetical protein VES65_01940 [Solirubrobacteraceae bacterium]|nr:hypothetical protein [Solirubrobacteraceae bacterium]